MTTSNIDLAEACGKAFVAEFGADCGTRLRTIAPEIGLEVVDVDANSYEGALLRLSGACFGTIVLNSRIREETRRLFTLGHEIGHYLLPNQQDTLHPCQTVDIENWGGRTAESEANRFAAEILMPNTELAGFLKVHPTFEAVRSLAAQCAVSLTAAAYRLVELTSHRAAIVWSTDGTVVWNKSSDEFDRAIPREALDSRTYAADWFKGTDLDDRPKEVPATAWLYEGNLREGATVLEHSVAIPYYGSVLSLIVIPERIEQNTEFDDEYDD